MEVLLCLVVVLAFYWLFQRWRGSEGNATRAQQETPAERDEIIGCVIISDESTTEKPKLLIEKPKAQTEKPKAQTEKPKASNHQQSGRNELVFPAVVILGAIALSYLASLVLPQWLPLSVEEKSRQEKRQENREAWKDFYEDRRQNRWEPMSIEDDDDR